MGVPMMIILITEVIDIVLLRTKIPIVMVIVMAVMQLTMDQLQMKWMTTQVYGNPKEYLKHLGS